MKSVLFIFCLCFSNILMAQTQATPEVSTVLETKHLTKITQLTYGGNNAEAYWSFDNKALTFQSDNPKWGLGCDQIFNLNIKKATKKKAEYLPKKISTGDGRTTCSYFMPNSKDILYASTHIGDKMCPAPPAPRTDNKYVWPIYNTFDIFVADKSGKIIKQLTDAPGYDAEATVSPDGQKIVFTSTRSGDLELWVMDIDGSNQKQITSGLGYDGGAFFSHDSKKLVFRASRPTTEAEIADYKAFLAQDLVAPTNMEIYTCNVDGSNLHQVTKLGKANWAPYFLAGDKRIIFSSNHFSKRGYEFQLFVINEDGTGLEQITTESKFNAFPMLSPDGKRLAWSSNRDNGGTRDTNVFMAEWKD